MPLTPEQIAKIRQKEAETPEALKRNPLNNYTEGWFHVTLNVRGEAPVLGYVVGDIHALTGSTDTGRDRHTPASNADIPRCELTELGKAVEEEWRGIGRFYQLCVCEEVQVMPEHIHASLHLLPGNKGHLGRIINGLMIGCSHAYWDMLGIPWREMRQQLDEALKRQEGKNGDDVDEEQEKAMIAQWQDRDHTHSLRGPALFTRGYNDVEAITAEEVQIKIEYIRSNPERRLIKGSLPAVFHVHHDKRSAHWTPERIMQGLCADRYIAASRDRQVMAWQQLTVRGTSNDRGKVSATLKFQTQPICRPVLDLVGNMELLQRPLYPLICHRADAALFEQQKEAVLKAAREQGAVIVTACVSPKERDIVKQLQQELLPVIEVMDNGFSEKYKPVGKAFYAVAEGRRLEVSPWEYEYRRRVTISSATQSFTTSNNQEKTGSLNTSQAPCNNQDKTGVPNTAQTPCNNQDKTESPNTSQAPCNNQDKTEAPNITREMCMVMNEVVRVIAQQPDDWWKVTK